jgi:hypothetical protein
MKVVIVTTRLFAQPTSGGEICTARLIGALSAAGHPTVTIGRGQDPVGVTADASRSSVGALVMPFEGLPRWQKIAAIARCLATGRALTVSRHLDSGATRRVTDAILNLARASAVDVLIFDHLQMYAWAARARLPLPLPAPVVVMHNLESDGYFERAEAAKGVGRRWHAALYRREARLLRCLEDEMLSDAAAVLCLSDTDAARLEARRARTSTGPLIDVLPGYPVNSPVAPRARDGLHRIGMIGTWTWGPNGEGLDWMLEQVLPLLPHHCRLVLAGGGLDGRVLPERVISLGRVQEPRAFYEAVDTVAIVAHSGSGVQEKAIEAIGSGRPIVATRHALRGLGPPWPGELRLADDATTFARLCALGGLSAEPAQTVSDWSAERGRRYAQALARALERALSRWLNGARLGGPPPLQARDFAMRRDTR